MIVWTLGYNPFVMGGSCEYILGTKVKVGQKYDLGKGYYGYLLVAPNGDTFVVESVTGAFVGPSIAEVRKDVKEGAEEVMKKQIQDASDMYLRMRHEIVNNKEFWRRLKRNG